MKSKFIRPSVRSGPHGYPAAIALQPVEGGSSGGGAQTHQPDPGTPAGTYNVTLTATAGSLSEQAVFALTV
ncbi:MAG: hypothetical protein ABSF15_18175 [Candidatus Sulfotelmatobacter sp.]